MLDNPWTDDDYTCPGESALRAYCEGEEEAAAEWTDAEAAWFRPVYQPCAVAL